MAEKLTYSTPVLKSYGGVAQLTQAPGTSTGKKIPNCSDANPNGGGTSNCNEPSGNVFGS